VVFSHRVVVAAPRIFSLGVFEAILGSGFRASWIAARAPPVWEMPKLAFARATAAVCVLAHTMRTGVTNRRNFDDPSLSAAHAHLIRRMTSAELQLSRVDRPSELIGHVWHVVQAIVGAHGVIVNDNKPLTPHQ
jgi:hypothetical protein